MDGSLSDYDFWVSPFAGPDRRLTIRLRLLIGPAGRTRVLLRSARTGRRGGSAPAPPIPPARAGAGKAFVACGAKKDPAGPRFSACLCFFALAQMAFAILKTPVKRQPARIEVLTGFAQEFVFRKKRKKKQIQPGHLFFFSSGTGRNMFNDPIASGTELCYFPRPVFPEIRTYSGQNPKQVRTPARKSKGRQGSETELPCGQLDRPAHAQLYHHTAQIIETPKTLIDYGVFFRFFASIPPVHLSCHLNIGFFPNPVLLGLQIGT